MILLRIHQLWISEFWCYQINLTLCQFLHIFYNSNICSIIHQSSSVNKSLVVFNMFSPSSIISDTFPDFPSVSVLIENATVLSDYATASFSPAASFSHTASFSAAAHSSDTVSSSLIILDLTDESFITTISSSLNVIIKSTSPGLTQLSQTKKTWCILYDPVTVEQFMSWWRATSFAKSMDNNQKHHIWNSNRRISPAWKDFQEVAALPDGQPKVRCSHCEVLLEHPQTKNTGTTAMSRHLESEGCSKFNQNQRNIRTMMLDSEVSSKSNINFSWYWILFIWLFIIDSVVLHSRELSDSDAWFYHCQLTFIQYCKSYSVQANALNDSKS